MIDSFIDTWIVEHGLVFAVEAALRCQDLQVARARVGTPPQWIRYLTTRPADGGGWAGFSALREQLRVVLAGAPELEYQAVVAHFAARRADSGSWELRLATSYLFPGQQDWVDADLQLTGRLGLSSAEMLTSALTTDEHLRVMHVDAAVPLRLLAA